tara:strand:- start:56469 stop:57674 length:1206 start_codon:yes stop_codon:yes gene_type:complete
LNQSELLESFKGEEWLKEIRKSALVTAGELKFPTGQLEKWKYSPIHKLSLDEFQQVTLPPSQSRNPEYTNYIEILDGHLIGETHSGNYQVKQLNQQSEPYNFFSSPDFFAQLNTALCPDPVLIEVPERTQIEKPIVILNRVSTKSGMSFPKLCITVGDAAFVEIVEIFESEDIKALSIPETRIEIGNDANVKYQQIQANQSQIWQLGRLDIGVGKQSEFNGASVGLGGAYSRMETTCRLNGRGASATLSAIYLGNEEQTLDYRTYQEHIGKDTQSNLLFKGVLDDRASSIYTGLIQVHKEASGTNAYQTNRTIKLSEDTWAESVPNLEIENNDVRCSHASTVSPVDDDQRFYLESRGIPTESVDRLIVQGFLNEVVQKLPIESVNETILQMLLEKQQTGAL